MRLNEFTPDLDSAALASLAGRGDLVPDLIVRSGGLDHGSSIG